MDPRRISPLSLFLTLASIAIVETLLVLTVPTGPAARLACLGGARVLEIGLVLAVMRFFSGDWHTVGLARTDLAPGFKAGLIWSVLFGLIAGLGMIFWWLYFKHDPIRLLGGPIKGDVTVVGLFLIVGGLVAPIAEEIVFRGVLYGFFRRYGITVALVITTGVFILAHINRGIPVTQTVGGIVFALSYETHGRLLTPITIHILGNMTLFLLPYAHSIL